VKPTDPIYFSMDMRIGELRLNISRSLDPRTWRDRPLWILEQEVRGMLMQILAPAISTYDDQVLTARAKQAVDG
jgi:hypothetical protein